MRRHGGKLVVCLVLAAWVLFHCRTTSARTSSLFQRPRYVASEAARQDYLRWLTDQGFEPVAKPRHAAKYVGVDVSWFRSTDIGHGVFVSVWPAEQGLISELHWESDHWRFENGEPSEVADVHTDVGAWWRDWQADHTLEKEDDNDSPEL